MRQIYPDADAGYSLIFARFMGAPFNLQRLNTLLKILVGVACLWFLYREIFVNKEFKTLWEQFTAIAFTAQSAMLLLAALLLVFVNWGLETTKWRTLISTVEQLSWFRAFKAVISGITISIFTPNRVGEFAARIFYLQSNHRIKGILISIIGSVSQLCVTVVAGSFCFATFLILHNSFNAMEKTMVLLVPVLLSAAILLLYFNIDLLRSLLLKINRARKMRVYLNVFTFYNAGQLGRVLFLSFLRFMAFSMQYFLLFRFFHIDIDPITSFLLSSSIFFVLAIIPTIALAELGIRGATALYFFNFYSFDTLGALASSYGLWCINLALPALLGLVFLPQLNFFRK
jgi:hypothetical protein